MHEPIPDMHVEYNRYRSTAVVPDRDWSDDGRRDIDPRESRGLPGTRAPHVELVHDGVPISAIDLYVGNFVLMVGPEGDGWCEAASAASALLGIDVECHCIGGDLVEADAAAPSFCAAYGIGAAGACLVRPDGYVAWRAQDRSEAAELEGVLKRVLSLTV
jgi:hypothetical protein